MRRFHLLTLLAGVCAFAALGTVASQPTLYASPWGGSQTKDGVTLLKMVVAEIRGFPWTHSVTVGEETFFHDPRHGIIVYEPALRRMDSDEVRNAVASVRVAAPTLRYDALAANLVCWLLAALAFSLLIERLLSRRSSAEDRPAM